MCLDPATMILGIAQTGLSIAAQKENAKVQKKLQAQASQRQNEMYRAQLTKMRAQEAQENIIASKEIQQATTKAMQAKSTARVAASEGNVGGRVVEQLLNDYTRQEAEFRFGLQQQQRFNRVSRLLGLESAELGYENDMARINQPIQQVNYLSEAVNLFGSGLDARKTYTSNQMQKQLLDETRRYNKTQTDLGLANLGLQIKRYEAGR